MSTSWPFLTRKVWSADASSSIAGKILQSIAGESVCSDFCSAGGSKDRRRQWSFHFGAGRGRQHYGISLVIHGLSWLNVGKSAQRSLFSSPFWERCYGRPFCFTSFHILLFARSFNTGSCICNRMVFDGVGTLPWFFPRLASAVGLHSSWWWRQWLIAISACGNRSARWYGPYL